MIRFIVIGNHEIETDSEEFFRKTIRELNKNGKVEGKDYLVSAIEPGRKRKETKPRP